MDTSRKTPGKQKKLRKRRSDDRRRHFTNDGQIFVRRGSASSFEFSDDSLSGEFESSSSKNTYTISSFSSQLSSVEGPSIPKRSKLLSSSGSSLASTLPSLVIEVDQTWKKSHPAAIQDIKRMTAIMERQRKEKTRNDWRKNFMEKQMRGKPKYHGAVFCNHERNDGLISFCDRCTKQFHEEIGAFYDASADRVLREVKSD